MRKVKLAGFWASFLLVSIAGAALVSVVVIILTPVMLFPYADLIAKGIK